jgi:hypothetical protein
MSWEIIHELAAEATCPYCGAGPHHRCKTKSGAIANYSHNPRVQPFRDAYWAGHEDQETDLLTWALDAPETFERVLARFKHQRERRNAGGVIA